MYLVDTNIWLERLLDQEKSERVGMFLNETPSNLLFITDFTFHSIAVIMHRLKRLDDFVRFVKDIFIDGAASLIHFDAEDTLRIVERSKQFSLDFDDAYQYVAAEKYSLQIVSFDADFDRTPHGRKIP